jgi:alanine racemase
VVRSSTCEAVLVDITLAAGSDAFIERSTVGVVTVRLSVRTTVWRSQIAQMASRIDGLVPVVKGNGYGFGRLRLAELAAELADTIAVGNVHELAGLPDGPDVVVLTPVGTEALTLPEVVANVEHHDPILTVGSLGHIASLADAGWGGRVTVKLASDMRRFGGDVDLVSDARESGLEVVGVSVHPPIAGSDEDHIRQVIELLPDIDPSLSVWVSHLSPQGYVSLPDSHRFRLRVGTALWHGDKSALHLSADVLDVRAVTGGTRAGYQQAAVPADGHLAVIGAGTANGVTPLADGRSPFHFAKTRVALHESPHMHVSMAFVPDGDQCPEVGDHVDVQRPLHLTTVDEYRWL